MSQEKLNCIQIEYLKYFQRRLRSDILWSWFVDEKFSIPELDDRIENMVLNGTIDGKPYVEPVKVPTDEDARSRPWVMVRDPNFINNEWNLRQLVTALADDELGKFICLSPCGKGVSFWKECRFPTEQERREHGIN